MNSKPTASMVTTSARPGSASCTVYAWCVIPGDHWDHASAEVGVSSVKADEGAYLTAHLLHLSGSRPFVGLEGADLTAEQARAEAVKLRAFAARLEGLVNLLDAAPVSVTA
ncbi:hypothetical protein [Streptomyces sp. NPDC051173]|uniref:hypothetical protein n=1 Tax=Streptomyces sp. NPDC051173 TaxID=3155164 RepID=UPI00344EC66E